MKKALFLILSICFNSVSFAQSTGTIEYVETMKMNIQLDDSDSRGDLAEHFPKEMKLHKILYYTPEQSIYLIDKNKKQDPRDIQVNQEGDGPKMIMKIDEPDEQMYCDVTKKSRIEKRDLFGRQFLVESTFDQMEWKLTGNQKMILDYSCQEAVLKDSLIDLKVWFTPALPVSTGPNGYCNLPGVILESNRDDGKQIITATKITMGKFDESIMVKPSGGKKMSKIEFNKLVEEKRKEMQEENGGEGNVIIKIRN